MLPPPLTTLFPYTTLFRSLETNLFKRGSKVIITAGVPVGVTGTTNLMKVHVIGNVITKGQGIGRHYAYGKAIVTNDAEDRSEEHTSELQSRGHLVCRLLLE